MDPSTALQVLVSPFLGVVFQNLGSLIQKEIGVVLGVNKELKKLSKTLSTIRDVIEDAEVKQIDEKPICNWLKGLKDLAYEADDILDECATEVLIPESIFQDIKYNYTDMVSCKMHDLVHDLACSVTVSECTVVKVDNGQNALKGVARHLSLEVGHSSSSTTISNLILSQSQPQLRTFLLIENQIGRISIPESITYSNLECLRVLDLSSISMHTLHVSIRNLKHLRYLNLSNWGSMRSLPGESICSLRNLQVLKLNDCIDLQVLPKNMRKLTNLRHLEIKGCKELRRMPVGMGNLICLRTLSMFVVVPESGRGISELHGLDQLTGELSITGLEHVRNSKDAKSPDLTRKKNISDLSLSWSPEYYNSSTIEEDQEIASLGESLQPHSNIKRLYINYYNGLTFPSWMSQHSCLPNLVEINIVGLRRCENLPSLGNLPLLESLERAEMDSLKCIGDEFYGHGLSFPALKKLYIFGMPNLEDWSSSSSKGGELEVFPSLEVFIVYGCPKLRTLPRLPSSLEYLGLSVCNVMILERFDDEIHGERRWKLGGLRTLNISSWDKMKILPKELLESLPKLSSLDIRNCNELVCLPEEMQKLTSLESFHISRCPSLKALPELGSRNNTTTLTRLKIDDCDGLTSVSDCLRHLTTLKDLSIGGSPELEFLQDDFQDLKSLRKLEFWNLPQMTCLPEGLQQAAGTLESLQITNCENLKVLPEWMDKFTSLQTLYISSCANLKVLPEEVLRLTNLVAVTISGCHPDLHRRYTKEMGEDWHKIAHIPYLDITRTPWW